jgi:prepilin-type N-terminal cleavage/methylation domain-containing protein
MKQKINLPQSGFTLMELLVVISIMGLVASIFIVNFAAQRGPRNLRIAQNELVTNIRKIQSYTLASRTSPGGKGVKYYYLQLRTDSPNNASYPIKSIDSDYSVESIETINLPSGIVVQLSTGSPQGLQLAQPVGATATYPTCTQIAFGAPFGKVYLDSSCSMPTLATDVSSLVALANSQLTITLLDTATNTTKTIVVNGISGAVCAPVSGSTC